MLEDIDIKRKDAKFKLRVSGIIIKDNKILVHKAKKFDGYCFPGGHVKLKETTKESIVREIKEEVGIDVLIEDILCIDENIYCSNGVTSQEINYYFYLKVLSNIETREFNKEEFDNGVIKIHEFIWIPIEEYSKFTIMPSHVADLIINKVSNKILLTDNR